MLTNAQIRGAKRAAKPWNVADGGGLHLLVAPNGGRYWRYNYRFHGKQKTLALGVYPDVTLAMARSRHQRARQLLADANSAGKPYERNGIGSSVHIGIGFLHSYQLKQPKCNDSTTIHGHADSPRCAQWPKADSRQFLCNSV